MDFARKQLEKYGWSDGKGLGKHENGISEALKPKLKRSVTGVGHDPASEFNEHWWSAFDDFVITSSTWKMNRKRSKQTDEAQYSEYFVRTAVLTNDKGGRKTENVKESESEDEDVSKKDVFKMTDEELFKACEGRTAHKIAEQEQMLLTQPQYEGYSHAKKLKQKAEESIEQITLEEDVIEVHKKKKKRKRCRNENDIQLAESERTLPEELLKSKNKDTSESKNYTNSESMAVESEVLNDGEKVKKSKKKKRIVEDIESGSLEITDTHEVSELKTKKKKKKKVKNDQIDC
ncbi:G patch domain-containing protein 4 [Operophtera brumata]|uniref:G patch domain-containing protein 4 n=1 Tax=Operophtera brumata TaxID=104452 RepID=A0A0L7KSE9_OPEBR|nr:G patch domain-containing protein 4 [Operophtera brumata]